MHIFNWTSDSIPYGPWLDCFNQEIDLGPYWVTLSGCIRDIDWRQILANDNHYIPVWKLLTCRKAPARSLCHRLGLQMYRRMTVRCPYDFIGPARASCGDLAGSLRLSQESSIIFGSKWQSKIVRCRHDHCAVPVRGSHDVTAMCLRAMGLQFFQICYCAKFNNIVEATMPVNPYDDRKVSLQRPYGNGDLDIVRASYTHRKANVTGAQSKIYYSLYKA